MYEQPKTSAVGRIVWFIISLLIIAGIVWLILWFFFWREPAPKSSSTSTSTGQSAQQSDTSSDKSTSSTTNSSSNSSASTPTSLGQVVEETSDGAATLVNTGPGDVVTPIVIAVAAGALFYEIRLRRKFVPDVE